MNHGYVAYDKQDNPTYFFQCEIEKLCKHIGTTVKNFKERAYSKRNSKHIGEDEFKVYMLDEDDTLVILIGEEDSNL